jgi:hypothetical protein
MEKKRCEWHFCAIGSGDDRGYYSFKEVSLGDDCRETHLGVTPVSKVCRGFAKVRNEEPRG